MAAVFIFRREYSLKIAFSHCLIKTLHENVQVITWILDILSLEILKIDLDVEGFVCRFSHFIRFYLLDISNCLFFPPLLFLSYFWDRSQWIVTFIVMILHRFLIVVMVFLVFFVCLLKCWGYGLVPLLCVFQFIYRWSCFVFSMKKESLNKLLSVLKKNDGQWKRIHEFEFLLVCLVEPVVRDEWKRTRRRSFWFCYE